MSSAVKVIISLAGCYALTALFVPVLLPLLVRLKAGQSIREEGPAAHMAKSGTPTIGGLSFVLAIVIVSLAVCGFDYDMLVMLAGLLGYGAIGFADDYVKVVKKRNLGLTAKQKIAAQLAVALLISWYASKSGTTVFIPFAKTLVDLKWFYIPFMVFIFLAMSNSVNLTDGLDGLASSVTAVCASCFAIIGYAAGADSMACFMAAVAGGCLGFLLYNRHPAKLFMGDTGSMALGGALAAGAIISGYELLLPIAGGIYVAEAVSVIIQVFVFKTQNGRRFFRMAPLHHHFELGGWDEVKVVRVFTAVTLLLSLIALAGVLSVR